MTHKKSYLVKPFDVLFFRDNKAFDFGEWYSEGIFPPYPSTFQGLVRTSILAKNNLIDNNGKLISEQKAKNLVGDDSIFPFEIEGPFICDGEKIFLPTPKDIVKDNGNSWKQITISKGKIQSDLRIPLHFSDEKVKIKHLFYQNDVISLQELKNYRLKGRIQQNRDRQPFKIEDHVGIKLDLDQPNPKKKTQEHYFYLTPFIRMQKDAGFYFTISSQNNNDDKINLNRLHGRLGSEGRGVVFEENNKILSSLKLENNFYNNLANDKKFKLILLTPGIFENGWLPFMWNNDSLYVNFNNNTIELNLLFATNNMPLRISGYSQLKQKQEGFDNNKKRGKAVKPQVLAVPAGSVYYFEIAKESDEEILKEWLISLDGSKIENGIYSAMGYNQIVLGKII